jgi:hypothetical protein
MEVASKDTADTIVGPEIDDSCRRQYCLRRDEKLEANEVEVATALQRATIEAFAIVVVEVVKK